MRRRRFLACLAVLLGSGGARLSAAPLVWEEDSWAEMFARRGERAFVVAFWSLECPPCYRELDQWAALKRRLAILDLVLVSVDGPEAAEEIEAVLEERGLGWAEARVFEEGNSLRLRRAVDPAWRGELPRTYFLRGGRVVRAVSGVPDPGFVEGWLLERP